MGSEKHSTLGIFKHHLNPHHSSMMQMLIALNFETLGQRGEAISPQRSGL